ncbi:MAG: ABC transporter substrate-binding protein, partial [Candidatus Eiseniibacteriota bacterium]
MTRPTPPSHFARHRASFRCLLRLACLAPLALAGCAPAREAPTTVGAGAGAPRWFGDTSPPAGNVFRFNLGAEPETYDPSLAVGQPDGRVARMLFEGLTREHPETLEPLPGQAYRWDISPDGKTYTFHLRPGLRWSDGRPVTSHDFRWT